MVSDLTVEAMPTVLRRVGFDVKIYFNDHAPPHVHVIRQSGEARIGLIPVMILGTHGLSQKKEVAKAKQLVEEEKEFLLRKWMDLHGSTIVSH